MKLLLKLLLFTIAVLGASYLLPGVSVTGITTAIIVALVLSLLNVTLKPLLILFTIPVTILTLGLFLLVINAIVIMVADYFISGFAVSSFLTAIIFSILLSILNWILNSIFSD